MRREGGSKTQGEKYYAFKIVEAYPQVIEKASFS
jgi:hypothetical protein